MEQETLQRIKERLLAEREKAAALAQSIKDDGLNRSMRDSIGELSTYDNHPADIASEVFERSKDLALRDSAMLQLQQIDDALARMAGGTYGTCSHCGHPIDPERLAAVPETTLCLDCRRDFESGERQRPRPIEEDVIRAPFGGFVDEPRPLDHVHFDGEDSWQAVARYGTSDSPQDIGSVLEYGHTYKNWPEDRGAVEEVDDIPYEVDEDGTIYGTRYDGGANEHD